MIISCEDVKLYKQKFNFSFLNVNNSLIIHDPELKLFTCIENLVIEGTVSQNFDIGPISFSVYKNLQKLTKRKITKSHSFFGIK